MDIDLMNTKIWVNNDRELIKKIELLAFKQGFGWINRIYSSKAVIERCYQKHTELKKIYALYFGETKYNNKYITQISSYHKPITKDYTHLDRYNSVTITNNIWCDDTYNSKAIIELFPEDIFKENTINLWI